MVDSLARHQIGASAYVKFVASKHPGRDDLTAMFDIELKLCNVANPGAAKAWLASALAFPPNWTVK